MNEPSYSYYEVLGIASSATEEEVRRAYVFQAILHHPQMDPESEELKDKYKGIQSAFDILNDPTKRREHDQKLHTTYPNPAISPRPAPPPPPSPRYLYHEISESETNKHSTLGHSKSGILLPSSSKPKPNAVTASSKNQHTVKSRFTEIFTNLPELQYKKHNGFKYSRLPGRQGTSDPPSSPTDPNPPLTPAQTFQGSVVDSPSPTFPLNQETRETVTSWQAGVSASEPTKEEHTYNLEDNLNDRPILNSFTKK